MQRNGDTMHRNGDAIITVGNYVLVAYCTAVLCGKVTDLRNGWYTVSFPGGCGYAGSVKCRRNRIVPQPATAADISAACVPDHSWYDIAPTAGVQVPYRFPVETLVPTSPLDMMHYNRSASWQAHLDYMRDIPHRIPNLIPADYNPLTFRPATT